MSLNLDRSTWKRIAFGDAIENITERVENPAEAGVERYVGLEHLDPGVMTVRRWDSPEKVEAQKLRFQPGDVIFGRRRAYQKKVAMAEFEGICSAHALVLRARPELVHPDFLPVFLFSDHFLDRAVSISVGSLSPTVNWRDLKAQEFDFPPLDEQKRIADLLWAIERHRLAVAALEPPMDLCQVSLMEVDTVSYVTVADVVSIARAGATPSRSNKAFYGGDIPWLKSGEVTGDGISSTEETITDAALDDSSAWLVPAGATVVAMYGDGKTRGQVGRLSTSMATNQAVLALVPEKTKCDPDFLYYWLRSRQEALRKKGAGAAQKNLNKSLVTSEPFPDLDVRDQAAAVEQIIRLDRSKKLAMAEVVALSELRSSFLAEIFGG
jgi:restriction endonuclease S subunit